MVFSQRSLLHRNNLHFNLLLLFGATGELIRLHLMKLYHIKMLDGTDSIFFQFNFLEIISIKHKIGSKKSVIIEKLFDLKQLIEIFNLNKLNIYQSIFPLASN